MKLVSDMKEFLILNDFPSVNDSISERSNAFQKMINETDQQLLNLKQDLALNLFELDCPPTRTILGDESRHISRKWSNALFL